VWPTNSPEAILGSSIATLNLFPLLSFTTTNPLLTLDILSLVSFDGATPLLIPCSYCKND
jgi:hypothetical protein